ncbi:bacteriohemerythrin [Cognaticolwellia mytili]|uniref:bacteriohemerythrin n=1 Tax=Cognaticolwellia mytili TaxID=1888913 RepID=UPI000A17444A|nr:bacteriohemerythrin [Cognaticolwellia mytili]
MTELIWTEGMSVGNDAIDEDHKQIIAILAKLTSAEHGETSEQTINEIFIELEHYVSLHFSREEALLEKAGYIEVKAHKASHQRFIDQLPLLKKEWLAQDCLTCSEKITTFLHQWLITHILEEDLDYVPCLHEFSHSAAREENHPQPSVIAKMAYGLSQRIKLSQRVFITTLLPILGVLLLSFIILFDNYKDYKNVSLALGLNDVIAQVNDISHSLQAERGLASGLISSNYQYFNKQFNAQSLMTDESIERFLTLLESGLDPAVKDNIRFYLAQSRDEFIELKQYRKRLADRTVSFIDTYEAYMRFIEQLLSISEHLTHVDMNSRSANDISAISALLLFKEYTGQVRALGMNMLLAQDHDIFSNASMSMLLGKQLTILRVFHYSASNEQKTLCATACDAQENQQLLRQRFSFVMDEKNIEQRSKYWFNLMSADIDKLKMITDELTANFRAKVQIENQRLENNYYGVLLLLSLFLVSATLFSLILNHSIINPIRLITEALNKMAQGYGNMQFKKKLTDDEIGAMQTAYEKLRRKLLQVDIFQAIVDRQQNEIEYRKSQQAHLKTLAYTDALTGAVNRRHFNKVLADEISQADHDQLPLSIMLLDIDYFKQVNDRFGHAVGDEVLIMFYRACKVAVRSNDVVARIGGEEFVIILPKTNEKNAFQFAERLRDKVQQLEVIVDENKIDLTVSIGVSQWNKYSCSSAEEFVANADRLLYQAKDRGRNRVVM